MAGPLSVDEILAKQRAEKEAAAKVTYHSSFSWGHAKRTQGSRADWQPKFLTKAQRAALALEKRNADVKAQQEREEAEKRERIEFEMKAEEERRKAEAARYGAGSNDRCE